MHASSSARDNEPRPAVAPVVGPDVAPGVAPDVVPGVAPHAVPGVASDVGTVVASDVGTVVASDVGTVVASDVGTVVASEVGTVVASDVGTAVASDVGTVVASAAAPPVSPDVPPVASPSEADASGTDVVPAIAAASEPTTTTRHIVDVNAANDTIELDLTGKYAQQVNWGVTGAAPLIIDEPDPLGDNSGPSPARVLASALASCLGASLLFCLRKSHVEVMGLHTTASTELVRNAQGRLRVGTITVRLEPVVAQDQQDRMARCIAVFEDYCIVTASVRPAVTVNVSVHPVSPPAH